VSSQAGFTTFAAHKRRKLVRTPGFDSLV